MDQKSALARLDSMVLAATVGYSGRCTAPITAEVARWCRWMGATEVHVEQTRPYVAGRDWRTGRVSSGRLDVVAVWPSGRRLAIEIDRGDKKTSVAKLRAALEAGDRVLWLRWHPANVRQGHIPKGIPTHWTRIAT